MNSNGKMKNGRTSRILLFPSGATKAYGSSHNFVAERTMYAIQYRQDGIAVMLVQMPFNKSNSLSNTTKLSKDNTGQI